MNWRAIKTTPLSVRVGLILALSSLLPLMLDLSSKWMKSPDAVLLISGCLIFPVAFYRLLIVIPSVVIWNIFFNYFGFFRTFMIATHAYEIARVLFIPITAFGAYAVGYYGTHLAARHGRIVVLLGYALLIPVSYFLIHDVRPAVYKRIADGMVPPARPPAGARAE